jgi:hypothetical protein
MLMSRRSDQLPLFRAVVGLYKAADDVSSVLRDGYSVSSPIEQCSPSSATKCACNVALNFVSHFVAHHDHVSQFRRRHEMRDTR